MSDQITLLFQNNHRVKITAAELSHDTVSSVSIAHLIQYVFSHWTQLQGEQPINAKQIRLIHLGYPLDISKFQKLGELNLSISDIIHVTVRPLESLEKNKKNEKSKKCLNIHKKASSKLDGDDNQGNELQRNEAEELDTGANGSGCCVIA